MGSANHNDMKRLVFVDDLPPDKAPTDAKKRSFNQWPFVVFALIFISFYASVSVGWLRPIADLSILSRLEPIIFVVIGFYFGRSSSVENENALQQQKAVEIRKADQAIEERDRVKKEYEILSERMKSASFLLNKWPLERTEAGGDPTNELDGSVGSQQLIHDWLATVKQILSLR